MIQDAADPVAAQNWFTALGGPVGIGTLVTAIAALLAAIGGCVKAFRNDGKTERLERAVNQLSTTVNSKMNQTMVNATTAVFHMAAAMPTPTVGSGQTPTIPSPAELIEAPAEQMSGSGIPKKADPSEPSG